MTKYGFGKTVDMSFDDAIVHVTQALQDEGFGILADIDVAGVADLKDRGDVELVMADLEKAPWPFAGRSFPGVVVTNYLWRPLLPLIVAAVAPGGALIYETFAQGNERFGKPSNPDFLLKDGELLDAVRGQLAVAAYECLEVAEPRRAMVQRIAAVRRAA